MAVPALRSTERRRRNKRWTLHEGDNDGNVLEGKSCCGDDSAARRCGVACAARDVGQAQQKAAAPASKGEQFFPVLVYRTGAYGPNGTPWANGFVDYLKLVNAQGGINGVKITWEECETGYATDRGVECYERLKTTAERRCGPAAVDRHHVCADRQGADATRSR